MKLALILRFLFPTVLATAAMFSFATHGAETPFGTAAVDENELHAIAGREDLSLTNLSSQTSNVRNNTVSGNSVTGTITFDFQALQNLSGLALVNANTGNNVSMNSSMMVNIAITP